MLMKVNSFNVAHMIEAIARKKDVSLDVRTSNGKATFML